MHEFHVYLTIHALVGVTTRDESNIDATPLPREDVTHVLPSPPFPSLSSTWGTAFVIHALEYLLFVIPAKVLPSAAYVLVTGQRASDDDLGTPTNE